MPREIFTREIFRVEKECVLIVFIEKDGLRLFITVCKEGTLLTEGTLYISMEFFLLLN